MRISSAPSGPRYGPLYVAIMILAGTLNTIFYKMQYAVRSHGTELCADPADPTKLTTLCAFDKPWFNSLLARIGMALPLVLLKIQSGLSQKRGRRGAKELEVLLPSSEEIDSEHRLSVDKKTAIAIIPPSVMDLSQTLLLNVGLLWVPPSVYQMACGAIIIFSALVSTRFLGTRLYGFHYVSIFLVSLAIALVAWAGAQDGGSSASVTASHALLGLVLIVLTQFITAVQFATEEFLMTTKHVDPLLLVGVEGLYGLIFYIVLAPVLTLTPTGSTAISKVWHENFIDSFVKLSNSPSLVCLCLVNILAISALGTSANYVTKHLSSVMRSIAEVLRTLGVWVASLFIYYVVSWKGANSPGEAWTSASWVELAGFAVMVYGTLVFKEIVRLPFKQLYPSK